MRCVALAAVLAAFVGCKKEAGFEGMPPAQEWNADQAGIEQKPAVQARGGFHGGSGFHGSGFHDTTPTEQGETDDETPTGGTEQPPPPDPDRVLDPTHRIAGVIKLGAKAKGKATAGTPVFVVAKHFDASGNPIDPALAVVRLTWKDNLAFELTEANAMIAGTELAGDVIVTAHYDQDSDALSKQPGDILGQVRVKVPADNVKLELDTVLP